MKKKLKNLWWKIEFFFEDTWTEIKNFPSNLLRGLKWFYRGYHSYEWDYTYLYIIIEQKLSDMEKCIGKYGIHLRKDRDCLIMRYALHHLSYMIEDYKCVENLFELHKEKFGSSDMIWEDSKDHPQCVIYKGLKYSKCKTEEELKYADKVHSRINKIWEERKVYHKRRFFYTFEKYIEYWWD